MHAIELRLGKNNETASFPPDLIYVGVSRAPSSCEVIFLPVAHKII